ncbi:MAG: protein kinase [Planctomycetes bacterium]|nr:protein kinase [Planctomycetota bacterium]
MPRVAMRMVRGARAGEIITLADNQSVIMGRGSESNFRIPDPSISRRHCQIANTQRGLLIADLGSSNGTYVNGQRLATGWAALRPNDQVILGQNEVRVIGYEQQQQQGYPPQQGSHVSQQQPQQGSYAGQQQQMQQQQMQQQQMQQQQMQQQQMQQQQMQQQGGQAQSGRQQQQQGLEVDPNLIDGYQIQVKLGQGAFGSVYRALQISNNQIVALKTIKPQLVREPKDLKRFFREAETGRKLVHPNITQIFDAGECRGVHWIAMEFIDGSEISKLIDQFGRLDVGYALRVVIQIANALQHAADQGIVHRDIKPENIMITSQCVSKLVDFGLAKSFEQAGSSGLTAPGEGMGTLAYMPPEQLDNALNADQRSDIYSLGATLYHMLSGSRPFNEKTTRSFIMKILNKMPPPIRQVNPTVPQELSDIIERAMAKKPEDRYQQPGEMEAELTGVFNRMAAEFASRSQEG